MVLWIHPYITLYDACMGVMSLDPTSEGGTRELVCARTVKQVEGGLGFRVVFRWTYSMISPFNGLVWGFAAS